MKCKRTFKIYGTYFWDFYNDLPLTVQKKIIYVLECVKVEEVIPTKFFKPIKTVKGLYEIRIEVHSNIYRVFCCFDEGLLIILFNGFQKKSQKTPQGEIEKAKKLMNDYWRTKEEK